MLEKIRLWHIQLLIAIVVVIGSVNYVLNMQASELVAVQEQQILNLESDLHNSNKDRAEAAVELQTLQAEFSALTDLQGKLFTENAELKKKLLFYQRILAPEKVINGVTLDSFTMTKEASTDYYYMQVVLAQVQRKKRHIKAQGELSVYGSLNGKPKSYKWKALRSDKKQNLSFSFRYFQSIEASIKMPSGFVPERVVFKADIKGNKWNSGVKLNQSFDWDNLLKAELADTPQATPVTG